ncbi:hypothetical protein [Stenotrophomonas sp.]|uniref:hypothetical protein n=1 Tax=Stenotrophomonas sp. TaxID=69392 RepID=UPI0028A88C6E|nr:hypothetical protein [Stenotrophomonas sp.]
MKRFAALRWAVCLVMLAALPGCVSLPKQQAYNREAVPAIKTIAVLPAQSFEPNVFMMHHPGTNFGLLGGLIAAGDMASKRGKLQAAFAAASFDPGVYFKDSLTQRMQERGYTLVWPESLIEAKSAKAARGVNGLRKSYAPAHPADAQLDINLNFVGYAAAGAGDSSPYRPTFAVSARLVSADGKQNYFTDYVVYNNVFNQPQSITLEPERRRFAYADFDLLEAAGPQTVEGMKIAIDQANDALVKQL